MTELTNPPPDHQITSQNSINLALVIADYLQAEMIALKSFVVDQIYMLKIKPYKIKFCRIMKTKHQFFCQIELLKNELRSKDTIIKVTLMQI